MRQKQKNFTGKCIQNYKAYPMANEFHKSDEVLIHIYENGTVLVLRPYERSKTTTMPTADVLFDTVKEAEKYFTCSSKTDLDVDEMFSKILSDRYW